MRKITLTLSFFSLMAVALTAQNFVSTTAENRNVVLEEFTGIYCTFCPDGHVRAQNLANNNPGDVVLVNVHTGGFAVPSGSDPDFQTSFGADLANQSGLTGYPAGTVNRRNFPGLEQGNAGTTAMSRGEWATAAATVLAEPSSVNVAAEAFIDVVTRELKVVVETYYTANATASSHKLNVALLQNNVEGPQTGAATYNPAGILPNGNYNHQHMLRHFLTGQWGMDITTTTMGHFQADTLTYTLPGDINGVGLAIADLEVVVYVAEGQQNILSGDKANMNIVIPAGYSTGDLGISASPISAADYCGVTFTPEVMVSNNGTTTINTYEVSYSINGGTPVSQTISTPIMAGGTNMVTFPQVTQNAEFTIDYEVEFVSLNANFYELVTSDNTDGAGPFIFLDAAVDNGDGFEEGFQNNAIIDPAPPNAIADNPDEIRAYVVNASISNTVNWNLGGNGNSDGCFRWDFYAIQTGSSMLIFEEVDLSNANMATFDFTHAYCQYAGENDRLEILASTDCGVTWTTLFNEAGASLSTKAAQTARFYPQVDQWQDNSIDVSSLAGQSNVVFAMRGTSDYGNSLYVDDIKVEITEAVNTNEVEAVNNLAIFPNPATTNLNVQFSLASAEDMTISVVNALGQTAEVVNAGNMAAGQHNLNINTTNYAAGVYFVNFNSGAAATTKRFVVTK